MLLLSFAGDLGRIHRGILLYLHVRFLLFGVSRQVRLVHLSGSEPLLPAADTSLQAKPTFHIDRIHRGEPLLPRGA